MFLYCCWVTVKQIGHHTPNIPIMHTHAHIITYAHRRAQNAESEVEALRKENERMQKQVQHARLGSMGKSIALHAPLYTLLICIHN